MPNFKENAEKIVKEAMLTMQKPLQNTTLNEMAKALNEDKIQYWALAKTTWKMLHPKE